MAESPLSDLISQLIDFSLSSFVLVLLVAGLYALHKHLLKLFVDKPAEQYRRQLIMLGVSLLGLVFAITIMPISSQMQGQLLGLLGILLSATIALSSTTLVGNAMAGLMLKSLRKIRPGKFIRVGDYYGRVSEMDLLHTEIQTEDRDLMTLPNLYLVTNPVTVLRASGTVLSVEVSLGYDTPRRLIEEVLLGAAKKAGLKDPFVQIRLLGDFSVTYRIAGIAENLEELLARRRKLRAMTLDELHGAGIEIMSPNYMNTRATDSTKPVIPPVDHRPESGDPQKTPDSVIFDKAQQAESIEQMREKRQLVQEKLEQCQDVLKGIKDKESAEYRAADSECENLQNKHDHLDTVIAAAESKIAKD